MSGGRSVIELKKTLLEPTKEPKLRDFLIKNNIQVFDGEEVQKIVEMKRDVIEEDILERERVYRLKHSIRWAFAKKFYLTIFSVIAVCLILSFLTLFGLLTGAYIVLSWIVPLSVCVLFLGINRDRVEMYTGPRPWKKIKYNEISVEDAPQEIKFVLRQILPLSDSTFDHGQQFVLEEVFHPSSSTRFLVVSDPNDLWGKDFFIHMWKNTKTES